MSTIPTRRLERGQRLVLHNVDWRTYSRLLRALDERPGLRLTYDRGVLEIMTLSLGHEGQSRLCGRFVITAAEELGLEIACGGSTTMRRRKKQRGLEPDECYWIANEARMRGKDQFDPRSDPPPDLALEVDITHSSLNRMAIYTALGIPEVWRYDGQTVTFYQLQPAGRYVEITHSPSFPLIPSTILTSFLAQWGKLGANALVEQFRAWIRQQLAGGGPAATTP